MKLRSQISVAGSFVLPSLVLLTASRSFADYPVMSHRYLADPGSLVYEGRVYLYNSNDDDNAVGGGYTMHSVVCVSSSDLKNWTDHGIVFQVPANASWARDSWAPQAIARNGKIFLYFGNNGSGIGVASSTSPTGGFKDAKGSYLINGSTPGAAGESSWLFDPGAFIDDDGQAYLSFGGNGVNNGRIIKLGSDLASVTGSAVPVSTTNLFEASFLFKRNGIYYFSYSTNTANGLRIDYLTSSSPMTGYTYRGVVAGQPPSNNNNNHASQFEFKSRWYHAYHNRYVATQAGISTTYRRNLGIEVLEFNADGSIQQVKYTTDGVPQVGNLDPYVRVEAETMNAQSGIETEVCTQGGMNLTQIGNGDWVRVRGVDFGTAGAKSFSARVAATASGGTIELRLGSTTGTLIGTCNVPATGGTQTWQTTTCDVTGATGIKDLYLRFATGNFNLDSWQFTSVSGSGGTGAGGASSGGAQGLGGATSGGTPSSGGAGGAATGGAHTGGTRNLGGATGVATGGARPNGGASNVGGATAAAAASSVGGASNTAGTAAGSSASGSGAFAGGTSGKGGATGLTGKGGESGNGGYPSIGGNVGAGGATNIDETTSEDGCSCRVPGGASTPTSRAWLGMLGVLLLGSVKRRAKS